MNVRLCIRSPSVAGNSGKAKCITARLFGGIAEEVPRLRRSPKCLFGFPALTRWAKLWRTSGARRLGTQCQSAEVTVGGRKPSVGGAFADGFFGEEGLLADAIRDFGESTLVGTDGGEVIGLADEIEGAEGFPDLFVTGVNGADFAANGYVRPWNHQEGAHAA